MRTFKQVLFVVGFGVCGILLLIYGLETIEHTMTSGKGVQLSDISGSPLLTETPIPEKQTKETIARESSRVDVTEKKVSQEERAGQLEPADLKEACMRTASQDNIIVVTLIGYSFREMFINFYISSVVKHDLKNVLFLATDHASCDFLFKNALGRDVTCFKFKHDPMFASPPSYGSVDHTKMTNYKTELALRILNLGYTVLITDNDIVYMKNPLPIVRRLCPDHECDVASQSEDPDNQNSGFMLVHPTSNSIKLFRRMDQIAAEQNLSNQRALNHALRTEFNNPQSMKLVVLDPDRFVNGIRFFPENNCPSSEKYDDAIIIHNNFLSEVEDKCLRFRECGLWATDGEDRYYSDPDRKYLQYSHDLMAKQSRLGLMNAFVISHYLNRTFILPKLLQDHGASWGNSFRLVQYVFRSCHWLENTNKVKYRENNFLQNDKVPRSVSSSLSRVFKISGSGYSWGDEARPSDKSARTPADSVKGPTQAEINLWFGDIDSAVILLEPVVKEYYNFNYFDVFGRDNVIFSN